jgi:hypothetical protein
MAFDVNEFISLKPIVDQLNQNPNSKIKISKSQSRVLASMPEEKFKSFLSSMQGYLGQPNMPANTSIFIENMQAIQSTRNQRLAARIENPGFVKAAKLKAEKEETRRVTSNFMRSQKEAINFLKQDEKPFNFLTKPYFKPGDPALRQAIQGDLLFRKQLDRNTEVMSRTRSIMPPMLDRPTIHRPIINAGAQKRLDSFKRAQEARVSTQGGQNTPIQQADSITPPPRSSSRVAQMLGEDTVRAASVIHSSKMNYATVGLAGMAAVFGIASASRQRKNIEQEIQSR